LKAVHFGVPPYLLEKDEKSAEISPPRLQDTQKKEKNRTTETQRAQREIEPRMNTNGLE
jgi:hypothetical protein